MFQSLRVSPKASQEGLVITTRSVYIVFKNSKERTGFLEGNIK